MGTDNNCVNKQVLCVLLVQERRRWVQTWLNRLPSAVHNRCGIARNWQRTGSLVPCILLLAAAYGALEPDAARDRIVAVALLFASFQMRGHFLQRTKPPGDIGR